MLMSASAVVAGDDWLLKFMTPASVRRLLWVKKATTTNHYGHCQVRKCEQNCYGVEVDGSQADVFV